MSLVNVAKEIARFVTDSSLKYLFAVEIEPIPENTSKPWSNIMTPFSLDGFPLQSVAAFKSVSGIEESLATKTINEINNPMPDRVVVAVKPGNVTLSGGVAFSEQLFSWYKRCRDWEPGSDDYRANVTIIQLKKIPAINIPILSFLEVDRWTLPYAWVDRYRAPDFSSTEEDVSIAELGITWDAPLHKDYSVKTVSDLTNLVKSFGILNL
jgi:phage tail-like protein